MGRPGVKSTAVVALAIDEEGKVRFDAIVKQGGNNDKIVQSTFNDIKEKAGDETALRLPTQEEGDKTAEATRKGMIVFVYINFDKIYIFILACTYSNTCINLFHICISFGKFTWREDCSL